MQCVMFLQKELSVIIPAYNEEKRIKGTIDDYYEFFSAKKFNFEIIVVANNCSDNTASVARQKKSKNIRVVEIKHYTGKGGAVIGGFKLADAKLIAFVDADNSSKPQELLRLIEKIKEGFDVAVGSRVLEGSQIKVHQPFFRVFIGRIFSIISNTLFGLSIIDTQCGCKVFRREVVAKILKEKISDGFEFDVQLLWIAKQNGKKIAEVPIKWSNAKDSKVGILDPLKMLIGLVRIRFF